MPRSSDRGRELAGKVDAQRAAGVTGTAALGLDAIGTPMSCYLGCLVNARRSLYQSKPTIEALKPNTAHGGCKANRHAARRVPSMACATVTPRQSRQPEPTQVSGLIPAQLRAWSCEIAAKQGCVWLDMDPTSDDQQRSSRIRPVVRRRSRITRKTVSFGRIHGSSKSGVAVTNGGL